MSGAEVFAAERGRLLGLAYSMLGQVADAEDVVQDAYLRWHALDAGRVENPAGLLTTMVTRLAIDRLRAAKRRREQYVGPWLPEPIDSGTDLARRVIDVERVGFALMVALERLNPIERAVLLLRDVFDYDYADVAKVVDRTPTNCRQIAARARHRVGDPRVRTRASRREARRLQRAFAWAIQSGDLSRLTALLADDAVCFSDGGASTPAARKPIRGAVNVAKLFLGLARKAPDDVTARLITVSGDPGYRTDTPDRPHSAVVLGISNGRIREVFIVVSPEKLASLGTPRRLTLGERVLARAVRAIPRKRSGGSLE